MAFDIGGTACWCIHSISLSDNLHSQLCSIDSADWNSRLNICSSASQSKLIEFICRISWNCFHCDVSIKFRTRNRIQSERFSVDWILFLFLNWWKRGKFHLFRIVSIDIHQCVFINQKKKKKKKKENVDFQIEVSPAAGRYLVAKKLIKAGQVILEELPLVTAPKWISAALCLGCYAPIATSYRCGVSRPAGISKNPRICPSFPQILRDSSCSFIGVFDWYDLRCSDDLQV